MLLALCFLLFTSGSVTLLFPETVLASGNVLGDNEGNELIPGQSYYLVSSLVHLGGGVSLGKIHNQTCALDVILLRLPYRLGIPVKLSILNNGSSITPITPISISFDTNSDCASSTEWGIDQSSSTPFVTIGGDNTTAVFRLIPGYLSSYNIMTTYRRFGLPVVGLLSVSDNPVDSRRFVVSQKPFVFSFIRARSYNELKDE